MIAERKNRMDSERRSAGSAPNKILESRSIRGEEAYIYGFKSRAQHHHCLGYGTASLDVSELLRLHKQYCRAVRTITLSAIYVKATALAIQKNPGANAILFRKPMGLRIVRFERVDVNLPITREVDGRPITFITTIRNAAEKSLAEIQEELSHEQHCAPEDSFAIRRIRKFSSMPLWLANLVHWKMTCDPKFYASNVGTCGVTFVGGDWFEHFFPIAPTSVVLGVGALGREPVVRGRDIAAADILKCSLMIDNYVISGLTAAALAQDLKELLESGSFLSAELSLREKSLAVD